MKIAFINIYNGVIKRGAETFVSELANRLAFTNEVTVFQSGDIDKSNNYRTVKVDANWDWSKKSGVGTLLGIIFLDYWSRKICTWSFKVARRIVSDKYDVVIPINGGWQQMIVRLSTWFSGTKMVVAGQSGIGWDDRINIYNFPDRFVALSSKALNWAKKTNPFVKSLYIPNGVDLNKFNSKRIPKNGTKTIIAVGAFTKQKRHELVIRALAKLKNTKLIIVGGGGELKEQLIRLGQKLLGNERFSLQEVDFKRMPEVYKKADVFTLASETSESFGIVFVEAMASGLPVVATDDPIRREIVGSAGLFVDPTDTDAYSKAIEKALNTNWGNVPRKQAEKFSWDKIASEYDELFKQIVKSQ